MKNRNPLIALVAGVIFGLLAFVLLRQKAADIERRSTPAVILAASHYIPAGVLLKPEMVVKKTLPESFVSPGAIHDLSEVEGLTTLVPLSAGEQVLSNKFGVGEDSLALSLNNGFRAYSLEVTETSGVGGLLHPGDRVDVLTKFGAENREMTSFVFQNLQVLAVGQRLSFPKRPLPARGSDEPEKADREGGGYSTVTLAVTPEQAETLMYLDGRALRLLLRAPGDDEIVVLPSRNGAEILARIGRSERRARQGVQIINGNRQEP